jgi:para-aminobenzoate synthetase / 4-amino-4-deoxychorismate lyase
MIQYKRLPEAVHALVGERAGAVLLESSRFDAENYRSYLFLEPLRMLVAMHAEELPGLFAQVDEALAAGCHVAGYLSYESGYHFQGVAERWTAAGEPLAWFGVYRGVRVFDHRSGEWSGEPLPSLPTVEARGRAAAFVVGDVALGMGRERYGEKIAVIQERIAEGATYQVNFTDRIRAESSLPAAELFGALAQQQRSAYSAMVNMGERQILSLSPELLFRTEGRRIVMRPMKGTWPRGMDAAEDTAAALLLQHDEKNRSEHLMIVDLERNDLGRVCETGSVRVEDLFSVERYETLLQMTSTVSGLLREGISWYELFRGVFPSGSITGAPKISTMGIIGEMEESARGVYTGSIGFIAPTGDAVFNVAIRTLVLEDGRVTMGVGGGIVADSDADAEYEECRLKASFLTRALPEFALLETMLWDGNYAFLELHMDRLQLSCSYFDFPFEPEVIRARLAEMAKTFVPPNWQRVRLTLDRDGEIGLTSSSVGFAKKACRVRVSGERTSSGDVFLRHKTTHRGLYDAEFQAAQRDGFDEVLFVNERDEVTEGAISSVFAKVDGRLVTPPLGLGVLPGIYRRHLLEAVGSAEERVLRVEDLVGAEEVYVCNSVRGLRRVTELDATGLRAAGMHG